LPPPPSAPPPSPSPPSPEPRDALTWRPPTSPPVSESERESERERARARERASESHAVFVQPVEVFLETGAKSLSGVSLRE
jgi:hypothetical protein